jgi:hypothetical protein
MIQLDFAIVVKSNSPHISPVQQSSKEIRFSFITWRSFSSNLFSVDPNDPLYPNVNFLIMPCFNLIQIINNMFYCMCINVILPWAWSLLFCYCRVIPILCRHEWIINIILFLMKGIKRIVQVILPWSKLTRLFSLKPLQWGTKKLKLPCLITNLNCLHLRIVLTWPWNLRILIPCSFT